MPKNSQSSLSKGVTPVIAVILLLLITISMVGFAFVFFTRTTETAGEAGEQELETFTTQAGTCLQIEQVFGNKVYVRNCGSAQLRNIALYVDDVQTAIKNSAGQFSNTPDVSIAPNAVATLTYGSVPRVYKDYEFRLTSGVASDSARYNPVVRLLSIYPCGCLMDDIANNFPELPIAVTCMAHTTFNARNGEYQDLIDSYDVIYMDGADCWGEQTLDAKEQSALKEYVRNGGGLVIGHDTVGYKGRFAELEGILGMIRTGGYHTITNPVKIQDDVITREPNILVTPLPTQATHTSDQQNVNGIIYYVGPSAVPANYNTMHYLLTNHFGSGRIALNQWGHSAYSCGCAFLTCPGCGLPLRPEQEGVINTVYWVKG